MFRLVPALAFAAMLLAGCATRSPPPPRPSVTIEPAPPAPSGWQAVATSASRAEIDGVAANWSAARLAGGAAGARRIAAEGSLLDPAAALALPAPTPGPYQCRLVRVGGRAVVRSYAADACFVDGDETGMSFTKQTGERLFGGWLYPDGDRRLVFLGTRRRDAKTAASRHGVDPASDVAGVLERIGPFRWRLVPTRAGRGGLLDVYELAPIVAPPSLVPVRGSSR
jgi:hypothetical protein